MAHHPSFLKIYPLLTGDPEKDRPTPIDEKWPWIQYAAVAGVRVPQGGSPESQKLHITWSPYEQPWWLRSPLPGFDGYAREAADEVLTKDDLEGLQEAADEIANSFSRINHLIDPSYLENQFSQIRAATMSHSNRVKAISAVEHERQAIPGIVEQLNREARKLSEKFVPAGRKLINKMLETIASMIMTRARSSQKDALEFSGQALPDLAALQQTPGVASLCRFGSFCEEIADQVADNVAGGLRAMDILFAAGAIKRQQS
jgi:hypothetical protein